MAILGAIGYGTAFLVTGQKYGLTYHAGGTYTARVTNARASIPAATTGGHFRLTWANVINPYMLPPDRGYRDFILKTKFGGPVVEGAKVTLYLRNNNVQINETKTTDSNGYVKFPNLSTASVYYVIANHPNDSAYNAARFDWLVPLPEA